MMSLANSASLVSAMTAPSFNCVVIQLPSWFIFPLMSKSPPSSCLSIADSFCWYCFAAAERRESRYSFCFFATSISFSPTMELIFLVLVRITSSIIYPGSAAALVIQLEPEMQADIMMIRIIFIISIARRPSIIIHAS